MHTGIRTIDFYADDAAEARRLCAALIERSAWFAVEPYPEDFWRFKVKPEQARFMQTLGASEVMP